MAKQPEKDNPRDNQSKEYPGHGYRLEQNKEDPTKKDSRFVTKANVQLAQDSDKKHSQQNDVECYDTKRNVEGNEEESEKKKSDRENNDSRGQKKSQVNDQSKQAEIKERSK